MDKSSHLFVQISTVCGRIQLYLSLCAYVYDHILFILHIYAWFTEVRRKKTFDILYEKKSQNIFLNDLI